MGSSPRFGNVSFAALGGRSPARLQGGSPDPTTACGHAACASILAAALTLACFTPGVLAPPTAQARPAPSLRSTPARAMPPGGAAVRSSTGSGPAGEARGWAAACGTRLESGVEMLLEHNARAEGAPLPTPNSTDAGEIAVLGDDGTFFFTDKGGNPILDLVTASRAFYRTHGDDYDCLAFYLASGLTTYLGSPTALASSYPLRSSTFGIGLDTFDIAAPFGSPARLENVLTMNGLHRYADNPFYSTDPDSFTPLDFLGHEFGHRWLAYVYVDSAGFIVPALLGRAYQHWNFFFDCDASIMEGCDWISPAPDSFRTDSVTVGYGRVDRYLMGLVSKAETDSFFVVNAPTAFDPPGAYNYQA